MSGKRLRIHGRVQGVFYRNWALDTARELGLAGWVRNRRDGSVEIEAHGLEEAIEQMIERCRAGPPAARVDRVDVEEARETPPQTFTRRPTE